MKEIFEKLAIKLTEDIGRKEWVKSTLSIIRLEGTVQFTAVFFDKNGYSNNVDVNFGFWEAKEIQKLYQITQTQPPIHTNWNKAKFTLYFDGRMEMEYIWDQKLQDEVDRLNKK